MLLLIVYAAQAQNTTLLDSLQQELILAQHDSSKVIINNAMGSILFRSDLVEAMRHYQDGLNICEANLPTTDPLLHQLFTDEKGASLNGLGIVHRRLGKLAEAIAYYQRSLDAQKEINDTMGVGTTYFNISKVYQELEDAKQFEYAEKSLEIRTMVGDSIGVANCYNALGKGYRNEGQHDKAMYYYQKSLKIAVATNDKALGSRTYVNLGVLAQKEEEYELALDYFNKAFTLADKSKKNVLAKHYFNIAVVYESMGLLDSAFACTYQSQQFYKEIGRTSGLMNTSLRLSSLHESRQQYDSALMYFKQHNQYSDSLFSEEKTRALTQQEMTYQFEKEQEARKLKHDTEQQEQRMILLGVVAIAILVLVFALFLYRRFQITRRQKGIIEEQKQHLEERNNDITASIAYAKRLQEAILPSIEAVREALPQSFVLYLPKDIVAGDFYWMEKVGDVVLLAAADCTGHGVPGAMVSVVCSNALNKSVNEMGITDPGAILDSARNIVIERFSRNTDNVKDGMDISLCSIHLHTNELKWAGANNPLWIVKPENKDRKTTLVEVKANKQPIGRSTNPAPFTTHTIALEKGDTVYLFSDGFADQFGGPNKDKGGKKLKSANFKKLLLSLQSQPMAAREKQLLQFFNDWKGSLEQIDDVCVVGFCV